MRYLVCLLLLCAAAACQPVAKPAEETAPVAPVESPTIASDISNQKINTFEEDEQGHIWIGTFRGLNKYNVYEYHQYFCNDDSLSLPDNQVNDIFRDSKNRLWIATVNGTCLYTERDNFRNIPINMSNKNGYHILENSKGRIFLDMVTQFCVFNPQKEQFDCVFPNFDPHATYYGRCHIDASDYLWDVKVLCLRRYDSTTLELRDSIPTRNYPIYSYLHTDGNLWLAGSHSLDLLDTHTRQYKPLPDAIARCPRLSHATVKQIHPYGNNGLLFYSDDEGLFYYNSVEQTVLHQSENGFPFEAPRFRISRLFTDSQKNLWIGSTDQEYTVIYNYKERFNRNNYLRNSIGHKSVVSLAIDKESHLWISTLMDGLYMYDLQSQETRRIELPQKEKAEPNQLFVDDAGALWITTKGHSVLKCRYRDGKLAAEQRYPIPLPMSITQDQQHTIWVGTATQHIYALRQENKEFQQVSPFTNPHRYTFIPGLLPHSSGELFVAAFYQPITTVNEESWEVRELPVTEEDWKNCIHRSVFIPTVLLEDNRQDVWIGTVSNGLMKYSPADKRLTPVPGISCTDIGSIEEDDLGNLWIGTMYGLNKYDRTTERLTHYYAADGIGGNQFYDRASCRLPDGTLVFGGTHGVTVFDPIDVPQKRNIPLHFEGLKVHNKPVHPWQDSTCISRHLSYRPDIHLDYRQNGFSISFAALDYCEFERVHYYYRLEGFDKYWVDAHNNREAYYANLPAGEYTFRVKITNNDKSIVEAENSIRVTVEPAPWNTWWARLCYLLVAAGIIGLFLRGWLRIRREREAVRLARLEKEQEQRVNRMNMSFFANISHEFRTPLTMIAGPVNQLCDSSSVQGEEKRLLYIVRRSVQRMLRLVNQLMDFNKLENDTLKLRVRHMDIIAELQRFKELFAVNAAEKGITLNSYGIEETFFLWLDADKLDKIVSNLLSNALKFTPNGGKIELSFDVISRQEAAEICPSVAEGEAETRYVKISVTDSGAGIPEAQLEKIFERYYQLNNQREGSYNWGTGIGLYYARSLALLHHGCLKAGNRKEGTGAVFTLLLPASEHAYSEEERAAETEEQQRLFPLQQPEPVPQEQAEGKAAEQQTILVVDDDMEVTHYLKALLAPHYRVLCHFDADSAFRAMTEEAPDLVLSDVVMPGASGYDLCHRIKEDAQLCHIPVLLVTAKATVENQVEGLETGADAYVTKPFDPSYLLALIRSQLKNREKVRNLLSRTTQTDTLAENVLAPQDNAFMTDLYRLMESELSNPELDVARMTELMHTSRTKFYYKVKGLTGENPGSFFKTYKLNRAAELIKEGRYTISEIADLTGFNTLSHFSTSFKKQFGVTPSDYGK